MVLFLRLISPSVLLHPQAPGTVFLCIVTIVQSLSNSHEPIILLFEYVLILWYGEWYKVHHSGFWKDSKDLLIFIRKELNGKWRSKDTHLGSWHLEVKDWPVEPLRWPRVSIYWYYILCLDDVTATPSLSEPGISKSVRNPPFIASSKKKIEIQKPCSFQSVNLLSSVAHLRFSHIVASQSFWKLSFHLPDDFVYVSFLFFSFFLF